MFENKFISWVHLLFVIGLIANVAFGQVCSPTGQLCTRTTDCCKGCCDAHTCVERSLGCADMMSQSGLESCDRFYCPPGQVCFLREVCPPEDPCPRMPGCRKLEFAYNYTDYRYYRNSAESSFSMFTTVLLPTAIGAFILKMF